MIDDYLCTFSDAQDLGDAALPADYIIAGTNVMDLGPRFATAPPFTRDPGMGEGLTVQFEVTTAFVDAGEVGADAAELELLVMAAESADLTVNPAFLAVANAPGNVLNVGYQAAALVDGFTIYLTIPRMTTYSSAGNPPFKRYLGVAYRQRFFATERFSAGNISARLMLTPPIDKERVHSAGFSF